MRNLPNRIVALLQSDVVKFGLVGLLSTIIDFAILNVFLSLGLSIFWAVFFSYLLGAVNGYLLNNHWTYARLKKRSTFGGFSRYASISFVGLGLTEIIVNFLYHTLHTPLNIDKLAAVVIVFSWNFLANRLFTFEVKDGSPPVANQAT